MVRWSSAAALAAAACFTIAAASAAPAPPPAPAKAPPPAVASDTYQTCMAIAHDDPQKGVERAIKWRDAGGGAPAEHCLATGLVGRGDVAEGAELLEELADSEPKALAGMRSRLYDQAGRAWLRAGKDRRAWDVLSDGLRVDPDSSDLLVDRAIVSAGLGLTWEAMDDLDRALKFAPDRADALVLRAAAWRRLGQPALAADDIERALAIAPQDSDALLERGNLYRAKGENAKARADWMAVVRRNPKGAAAEIARRNIEAMDVKKK